MDLQTKPGPLIQCLLCLQLRLSSNGQVFLNILIIVESPNKDIIQRRISQSIFLIYYRTSKNFPSHDSMTFPIYSSIGVFYIWSMLIGNRMSSSLDHLFDQKRSISFWCPSFIYLNVGQASASRSALKSELVVLITEQQSTSIQYYYYLLGWSMQFMLMQILVPDT